MDIEIYEFDGKEYELMDKLENNGTTYYYFSNANEESDYVIKKLDPNDHNSLIPLDDEDEVKRAVLFLANKQLMNE